MSIKIQNPKFPIKLTQLSSFFLTSFPHSSDVKESACYGGDLGFIPGLGRSPGEGTDNTHTSLFLPGEFHGQRSLARYSPWSLKESDRTELLTLSHVHSLAFFFLFSHSLTFIYSFIYFGLLLKVSLKTLEFSSGKFSGHLFYGEFASLLLIHYS